MTAKVNILMPPVWSSVYHNIARLLKYSLEDIGMNAMVAEAGQNGSADLSIVLGWNLIPPWMKIPQPYILYQLEPLGLALWREKLAEKDELFRGAAAIWDYTEVNMSYEGVYNSKTTIIAPAYHSKLEEVTHVSLPDYDVLFTGFVTGRRKEVLEELQKHCCVSVQPRWGRDFTDALGRSKIFLNIHQYDHPTPLEQTRLSYVLNNGCCVITESAADDPYQTIISVPYEHLPDTVLAYLHNPVKREDATIKMTAGFKQPEMVQVLRKFFDAWH
jgi:hypothetical protein